MTSLIVPWPTRHPALLDSAGVPVLLVAPDTTRADQPGMPLDCPTQDSGELIPSAHRIPPSAFTKRTAQIVTPSAVLRELLTRCLLNAECRMRNVEEEGTETRQADVGAGTTTATSEDPIQRSAFRVQPSHAPDLVLLDLAAPNALTHCQQLRRRDPDLPIVALVALKADQTAAWEAGANAVLPIPFEVQDLHAHIQILLEEP